MSNIEFNPNLDKITEQEVVYDFFSRLSLGHDMSIIEDDPDGKTITPFIAGDNVKEILLKTVMAFPPTISNNLKSIRVKYIDVDVNDNLEQIKINLPENAVPILIYAERTMTDLTNLFEKDTETTSFSLYIMELDTPYANSEKIKVYYTILDSSD